MTEVSPLAGNPLRAIMEVSAALVSSPVYEEVLSSLVEKIGLAMDVWSCDLMSYVPERDVTIYEAVWQRPGLSDDDRAYIGTVSSLAERPDVRALIEGPGLFEQHLDDRGLSAHDREQLTKWGYKSTLDMPLRIDGRVIGLLGVQETRFVRRFMPAEHEQFARLCQLAAIGIYNAQVLRADRERARHLASLYASSHAMVSVPAPDEALAALARAAGEALDAPRAVVYSYEPDAGTMTPRAIYQAEYDEAYDTLGVAEPAVEVIGDLGSLERSDPWVEQVSDPELPDEVREAFLLWSETTTAQGPLLFCGKPLGVLMVAWTGHERLVTSDELAMVKSIGQQAAMALARIGARAASRDARSGVEGDE